MKSGKHTARSIAEKYLARVDQIDKQGPAINSIIELNPDALAIADSLDKERKEKGMRGPLHGIPVMIKDNIDTADKMMTTAGSLALLGSRPSKDSTVAQKLREAGAVILAKDESQRMGQYSFRPFHQRLERPRRPDQESLRPRPQPLRLEFWLGRRRLGQSVRSSHRHGNRRFDRLPLFEQRPRRHQAHRRPG